MTFTRTLCFTPSLTRTARTIAAFLVLFGLGSVPDALGIDRIRSRSGTESGEITKLTPLSVTISKGGVEKKIPVEEIRSIDFAEEPDDLRPARMAFRAGRFEDALERLEDIDPKELDREAIRQDVEYLDMACQVQLALAGQGDLAKAEEAAGEFLRKNRKSYRVPSALELRGTVLMSAGQFDAARKEYEKLARAPAAFFQARSALLQGILLQQEDKHGEALAQFEKALAHAQRSPAAEADILEATLHRAISQSAEGRLEEATSEVKRIIATADPEDAKLLARAYNALGDCYLKSENDKAALDAYLHVDILFSSVKTEHAKSLYELSKLWRSVGHESRASDAQTRLKTEYPSSRWARQ